MAHTPLTADALRAKQAIGALTEDEIEHYDVVLEEAAAKGDRHAVLIPCPPRNARPHYTTDAHMRAVEAYFARQGFKATFSGSGSDQRHGTWPANVRVEW